MPAEVTFEILGRDRLLVLADGDRDRTGNRPDAGVAVLDAAVEEADAHALPGRPGEGPFAVDALRQGVGDLDPLVRVA